MTTLLLAEAGAESPSAEGAHDAVGLGNTKVDTGPEPAGAEAPPGPVLLLTSAGVYDEIRRRLRRAGESWD